MITATPMGETIAGFPASPASVFADFAAAFNVHVGPNISVNRIALLAFKDDIVEQDRLSVAASGFTLHRAVMAR